MTMVERIARANYDRRQQIGWECGIAPTSWEDAGPSTRAMEKDCARAALNAMIEATPAMIEAVWFDVDDDDTTKKAWQAMLSAALDEGEG